jgi:dGTP triphosphohydrolase
MAATQGALETQIAFLQEEIQENQVTYNQDLEAAITSAERNLADLRADLEEAISFSYTQIPAQLATLSARQEADSSHISALATAQMKYRGSEYEGEIARIIAHLSRANQFLLHANYGLAKDQLIAAQQVLLEMEIGLENGQLLQAQELLSLIEGSIADLPEQPALAAGRLELAWELAVSSFLPFHEQNQSGTPSPTPWETITPTTTPN